MKWHWQKWVEKELRYYMCRQSDIEHYQQQIDEIDNDIWIRTSRIDGMPRTKGVSSIVERQLIQKEKAKKYFQGKIERIKHRANLVEAALDTLPEKYRELILMNYFSVYAHDGEIARRLGCSLNSFYFMKETALGMLYDALTKGYGIKKNYFVSL